MLEWIVTQTLAGKQCIVLSVYIYIAVWTLASFLYFLTTMLNSVKSYNIWYFKMLSRCFGNAFSSRDGSWCWLLWCSKRVGTGQGVSYPASSFSSQYLVWWCRNSTVKSQAKSAVCQESLLIFFYVPKRIRQFISKMQREEWECGSVCSSTGEPWDVPWAGPARKETKLRRYHVSVYTQSRSNVDPFNCGTALM